MVGPMVGASVAISPIIGETICRGPERSERRGEDRRDHAAADEALQRAPDDHLSIEELRPHRTLASVKPAAIPRTGRACRARATESRTAGW